MLEAARWGRISASWQSEMQEARKISSREPERKVPDLRRDFDVFINFLRHRQMTIGELWKFALRKCSRGPPSLHSTSKDSPRASMRSGRNLRYVHYCSLVLNSTEKR